MRCWRLIESSESLGRGKRRQTGVTAAGEGGKLREITNQRG